MDASEVAKHNTKDSCWVVIHGTAWDVTDFLEDHPGGVKLILRHAGGDATEAYESIHNPDLITETLPPARCLGAVDLSSVVVKGSDEPKQPKPAYPSLGAMINVEDFEKVAEKYLTATGWAYYSSGAEDELSIQESRRVFRKLSLRPRILRDVDNISTVTDILGIPSSLPIYISPTGSAKFAHPEAEPLIVSAAGKEGIIYCMPTSPSASLEAIFGARVEKSQPLFFQLYVNRDKEKAKATIRRAVYLGAKAIFITVDSPVIGKRERDERLTAGDDPFVASTGVAKTGSAGLLNAGLTWKDLVWIRETTSVPLVIKGIQSVEDAVMAYQHGVDGIILSNHGGRSQDTAQTPMITLLEIRKYAPQLLSRNGKKFQVFLDGGIRRGTDVIKALALGATAVGIGRPVLYSMTAGYGENGIRRLIQILRAELETNMAMVGAARLEDLVPEMVNSERAERGVSLRVKL
ncbi:glycolate oxidase [Plectosphaerella plurivora]|uniref:Glycolate oxidase n=1 Tax=Plectosphaerella plurivora TaxID=936078 RepID=A0A9P8V823_9PEZI|nr:glycolate oxidase [Plectosphaerella plurivora]